MTNRSTLFGFIAILLWSSTVALARSISEQIGSLLMGSMVYLTAGFILLAAFFVREKSIKKILQQNLRFMFVCGLLFLIYTFSLFLALGFASDRLQTVEVGLLNYLWPSLTLLFSLPILRKKAKFWLTPGTLLAFSGVVLVLTQGSGVTWDSFAQNILSNPLAYGLGLTAAISWALYSNLTRLLAGANSGGEVSVFILLTGAAFGVVSLFKGEQASFNPQVLSEIGMLALFTALAYIFWDIAMRKGDLVLVAAVSYLTPLLSTIVSCLYLQILPGISLWLGCVLVIAGSFLSWWSFSREER
jgi:drug/metabolite transporter (DMT)-like permease